MTYSSSRLSNRDLLEELFSSDQIDIHRAGILNTAPTPLARSFSFDRIEGMLLGLAIGDGLGITSEGKVPHVRWERYGEVRDYLPNKYTGERKGYPSDDTQLAFWTLDCLLEDGGLVPDHVAAAFCRERIIGIGHTVKEFSQRYRSGIRPWHECSIKSAGNGALDAHRADPTTAPYESNRGPLG